MSNPDMNLYNKTFFDGEGESSDRAASEIIPLIQNILSVQSVLDVGCGVGSFLRFWKEQGLSDIMGVDGAYLSPENRVVEPACFMEHDLQTPFHLNRKFDLVMSLEVAEHLPAASADSLVTSLCEHGDVILFSAAIPAQGGVNHVNEQWPSYWAAGFATKGFRCIDYLRPLIWNNKNVDFWYSQNSLIFANEEGLRKNPKLASFLAANPQPKEPLSLIHPAHYVARMNDSLYKGRVIDLLQNFLNQLQQLNQGK